MHFFNFCTAMIISIIIKQAYWYERVYFVLFPVFGDTRKLTQFIKAYTIECCPRYPPACASQFLQSKISTHLCQSRPKTDWSDQKRKPQLPASTAVFQLKKFSGHLLRAGRHPTTKFTNCLCIPISSMGVHYTDDDCHILSARAYKCSVWL